ncbi:hypothetical protein [Streptomyces niger]|uniref:hypothetical protein n=1 Tax=Streptomyces niger TaxID=66373 RepID=UPI0018FE0D6F|nr:hypothetical protein [Streptomyces niger]
MQHWSEESLAGLQAALAHETLQFTAPALGAAGPLVRGVLPPPEAPGVGRVVVWDGDDLASSVAYDLPLVGRDGDHVPADELSVLLRRMVRQSVHGRPTAPAPALPRDTHGFPVVPVEEATRFLEEGTAFHVTDALRAAVAALCPPVDEDEEELRLRGFLLLDERSVRLYVDGDDLPGVVGLDVALRDENGAVTVGITALAAALPTLVTGDQLKYNPSDAVDHYCSAVYDLTCW